MSTTYTILKKDDYYLWDEFVDISSTGSFFNKTKHVGLLCQLLNLNFDVFCGLDADGKIQCGACLVYKKKFGINYCFPIPLTLQNNVIVLDKQTSYQNKIESFHFKVVGELIEFIEQKIKYVTFSLPYCYNDIRPYTWNGYSPTVNYTFTSKLHDFSEIYKKFDPDIKRRIKHAEKRNPKFEVLKTVDAAGRFFDLQRKTFDRQKVTFKLNRDQFLYYFKMSAEFVDFDFFILSENENDISGALVFYDQQKAIYMLAGSDPDYYKTGLNQLFMKLLFNYLCNMDEVKEFDFAGANTPSISYYKTKYNLNLTHYYSLKKTIGNWPKLLFSLKEKL